MTVAVIDLRIGNVRSVLNGFRRVGCTPLLATTPGEVGDADAIVVPGVGAFGRGMERLKELDLVDPIRRAVAAGRPFLGICLGMHLMADRGFEHGTSDGLGLIPGEVHRLTPGPTRRVPNMGWCDVRCVQDHPLIDGATPTSYYFAHSYHFQCAEESDCVAIVEPLGSAAPLTAMIGRDHVVGVQFHPEKSQDAGLAVLERFVGQVVVA